jgi:23S rRNA (adenine2503-C2)-methyltransferase
MPHLHKLITEVSPDDLAAWFAENGHARYRCKQFLDWIYVKRVASFDAMKNLPAALRTSLAEAFQLSSLELVGQACAADGETEKFVFQLVDGHRIESVLMRGRKRATFCVSTQVGCGMGCRICATGVGGLKRNLRVGEILDQVLTLARKAGEIGNVVFMGMGEPLANLANLLPALDALVDEQRFALGARRISVSTAGLAPEIRKLADAAVHPNLALSLNAPFDKQRNAIMPINRRHPLADVVDACEEYGTKTGRRISLEYVMLAGVNTSMEAACEVARIARRLSALVNLIAFNPVPGSSYTTPKSNEIFAFRKTLEERGINVTQRFRRGRDIAAGCGQLAERFDEEA